MLEIIYGRFKVHQQDFLQAPLPLLQVEVRYDGKHHPEWRLKARELVKGHISPEPMAVAKQIPLTSWV